MKLGFYDSGLGGLSVLKEFIAKFKTQYSYFYFGDSARAPYGNRSKEELKAFIVEILDMMQEEDIDIVISACNTTSMLLSEIDLEDYSFPVIGLYEVMKEFFQNSLQGSIYRDLKYPIALLATVSTIDSGRYKDWGLDIHPVKCPDIVPLIEAGDLAGASQKWHHYLSTIPQEIKHVIVGCTHFSFMVDDRNPNFEFIDPGKLAVEYFSNSVFADSLISYDQELISNNSLELEVKFSKNSEAYSQLANRLISY